MPALVFRARDGSTRRVELSDAPVTLGRSEHCDVVLVHDGEVSREHARVWIDGSDQVYVEDLGSKNGTRVDDGSAFHGAARPAQHCVQVGQYRLEITGTQARPVDETVVRFQPDTAEQTGNTRFLPSSRGLDLNQQRLNLLMSLTERIGGAFEQKQLLEQALDACCEALGFERGLIVLKTPRGETDLPVTRNVERDETGAFKVSRTLINRALVDGERAVVNNPAVDLVDNLSESLVRFPICSALCVPIQHRERILGVLYGDRITRAATYTTEDVDFLAAIARQVGVGLETLRLFKEHVRTQQILAQLEEARRIQRGMLPDGDLCVGDVLLTGHNEPSETVGGDLFDYFALDEQRVGFIIADVTGHGLPAALVMANLQAAFRIVLTADISLGDVARRLNHLVHVNTSTGVFITAILGRIDTSSGAMELVNAGHPAPLVVAPDDCEPLDDGMALPFGVERDEAYEVQRLSHKQAGTILLYTDGLTEAAPPDGALLGIEPVAKALRREKDRAPEVIVRSTLATVRGHLGKHKNADDLTLLLCQIGC